MKNIILVLALVFCCQFYGQDYTTIGNQTWTNKNLDITVFRNGESIPESKTKEQWLKAGYREEPTWCYYNFDEKNAHLGKLYNYYAATSPNNIAPIGWKVPTMYDYLELIFYLDPLNSKERWFSESKEDNMMVSSVGGSLKKDAYKSWGDYYTNNCWQIESGFDAIFCGIYMPSIDYPQFDWSQYSSGFWCNTGLEDLVYELKGESRKAYENIIATGLPVTEGVTFEMRKGKCTIKMGDRDKIDGLNLRLIKETK